MRKVPLAPLLRRLYETSSRLRPRSRRPPDPPGQGRVRRVDPGPRRHRRRRRLRRRPGDRGGPRDPPRRRQRGRRRGGHGPRPGRGLSGSGQPRRRRIRGRQDGRTSDDLWTSARPRRRRRAARCISTPRASRSRTPRSSAPWPPACPAPPPASGSSTASSASSPGRGWSLRPASWRRRGSRSTATCTTCWTRRRRASSSSASPRPRRSGIPAASRSPIGRCSACRSSRRPSAATPSSGPQGITTGAVAQAVEAAAKRHGGILTAADLAAYEPAWREPLLLERLRLEDRRDAPPLLGRHHPRPDPRDARTQRLGQAAALRRRPRPPARRGLPPLLRRPLPPRRSGDHQGDRGAAPRSGLDRPAGRAASSRDHATPSARSEPWPGAERGRRRGEHRDHPPLGGRRATATWSPSPRPSTASSAAASTSPRPASSSTTRWTTSPPLRASPTCSASIQGEANAVAPGKRMLSSMMPTIAWKGSEAIALGGRGGSRIPTNSIEVLLNLIADGDPLQAALDRPRLHHQWLPDRLEVEADALSPETRAELERRGHTVAGQRYDRQGPRRAPPRRRPRRSRVGPARHRDGRRRFAGEIDPETAARDLRKAPGEVTFMTVNRRALRAAPLALAAGLFLVAQKPVQRRPCSDLRRAGRGPRGRAGRRPRRVSLPSEKGDTRPRRPGRDRRRSGAAGDPGRTDRRGADPQPARPRRGGGAARLDGGRSGSTASSPARTPPSTPPWRSPSKPSGSPASALSR